jgi:hypothetical protein
MRKKKIDIEKYKEATVSKAVGAEDSNIEEASNSASSFNDDNSKVIKFPAEFIQRMQYEIKKTFKNNDDFLRIAFVSKALSNEKYEPMLYRHFIKIETRENDSKRIAVATDGRRLHVAEISYSIPEGYYSVIVKKDKIIFQEEKIDDNFKYPNYRELIPSENNLKEVCTLDLCETSLTKNLKKNGFFSKQFAKIIKNAEKIINIRYLDDLAKMGWRLYVEEKNGVKKQYGALVFKAGGEKELLALIAPMMDDD